MIEGFGPLFIYGSFTLARTLYYLKRKSFLKIFENLFAQLKNSFYICIVHSFNVSREMIAFRLVAKT